ncbi:RDD family protein [Novosphingobium sp. Gsoil 351]|uniref:RDD family protein n=1 Tax=Novosphingobium sp. Gsoil 351 TaxID=2675225 RepID=UPI0012B4EC5C|nr:RDD family protein [Novosphingobium sp. Gsoil 351]QGN54781.1 RDD family protein [Novosphingobium sp. Gsoil 351]
MSAARTAKPSRPVLDTVRRRRTVVTPEGIALDFTVASRSSRAGALLIDLMIVALAMLLTTLLLIFLLFGTLQVGDGAFDQKNAAGRVLQGFAALWIVAMFLFRNAYFLFFELRPRGATPGKRMAGIRIAARDGAQLTAEAVIARNLVRDIELFLPAVFFAQASQGGGDTGVATFAALAWLLVFLAIPLAGRDRLRAGDIIAGSWVVEAPRAKLATLLATGTALRDGTSAITGARFRFSEAELAVYGEYELQTLERVLRDGRGENLVAVTEAICRKIGWEPGRGDERAFLEAYYAQLRARLEKGMRFGKRKADKHAGEG